MEDLIERLTRFTGNSVLTHALQSYGMIAGGSMVYALNSFVPAESVNDIDIFLWDDSEKVHRLKKFIIDYYGVDSSGRDNIRATHEAMGNVVTLTHRNRANIKIQLIFTEASSPMEILESFDFDYVQCGLHNGKLYQTDRCKKSHKAQAVLTIRELMPKDGRCLNAIRKMFKCPLIGERPPLMDEDPERFNDNLEKYWPSKKSAYLETRRPSPWLQVRTFQIEDVCDSMFSMTALTEDGLNYQFQLTALGIKGKNCPEGSEFSVLKPSLLPGNYFVMEHLSELEGMIHWVSDENLPSGDHTVIGWRSPIGR